MKVDTGGPAFPQITTSGKAADEAGMTWLDQCAIRAMAQFIHHLPFNEALEESGPGRIETTKEDVARRAYKVARAMLAEKRRLENEK